jgi:amino-acid N-acetyltransferase
MDLRDVGSLEMRPATEADRSAVNELLLASALQPLEDSAQFGPQYAVALCEGKIVGVAGMDLHGDDALLRSVAVSTGLRSLRVGSTLAENRLDWARDRGIRAVYLLTETSARYWTRFGFQAIDRTEAPEGIAASHQWLTGCPSSAIAMRLLL